MTALAKAKHAAPFTQMKETIEVMYDFSVDGGAVGALDVLTADEALVVHSVVAKVKTACTSGGSATVSLGKSGDAAGLVAATAVASLTAGALIDSASFGSGYKLASGDVVQMDIAVAALTAGKIVFEIEVSRF
jgi:hypothetical protein